MKQIIKLIIIVIAIMRGSGCLSKEESVALITTLKEETKMNKTIKQVIKIIIIVIAITTVSGCLSKEESTALITTLKEETKMNKTSGKYTFEYENTNPNSTLEKWTISFMKDNIVMRFKDSRVRNILTDIFGGDFVVTSEMDFGYNSREENAIRIYFDEDTLGISLMEYDIVKDKLIVNSKDTNYRVSEAFRKKIDKSKLIDIMKQDLYEFRSDLKMLGISYESLKYLNYETIDKF